MNKNLIIGILMVLVLATGAWYFAGDRKTVDSSDATVNENMSATSTATTSTSTDTSATTTTQTNNLLKPKPIPGYPSSWPSDVPKYPVQSVKYTGGNNPQTTAQEATVVFATPDQVKSVVNFYLNGLKANGWKITEDGKGLANQITLRATKNRRGVGVYVDRDASGKTNVTVGVNIGI